MRYNHINNKYSIVSGKLAVGKVERQGAINMTQKERTGIRVLPENNGGETLAQMFERLQREQGNSGPVRTATTHKESAKPGRGVLKAMPGTSTQTPLWVWLLGGAVIFILVVAVGSALMMQ